MNTNQPQAATLAEEMTLKVTKAEGAEGYVVEAEFHCSGRALVLGAQAILEQIAKEWPESKGQATAVLASLRSCFGGFNSHSFN